MKELLELRLEVLPGLIKATGSLESPASAGADRVDGKAGATTEKQVHREVLTLHLQQWLPARKNEVLLQLSAHPGELYDLLQGSLNGGLATLDVLPADNELEQAADEQGTGLLPAGEVLLRIRQQLVKEPLLAFALRGLSKEELLTGVFALWAEQENERIEEEGAPAPVSLASELARLERKGPAVSSGEWLAEAAAEGSLHQPGPLFHEISSRPFPAMPEVIEPEEDWSALLPQTPKAREGLALLMRRVSEAAAARAAGLNKL
ncbi:hypothetical protein KDC22_02575 [Paenibacillus tritici]|uniref:hypothetical protein n=1 Tax=Paenibacillus tritici TaxID=1873425 RepID=UPI001BABC1B5|nr:hypothetical protein [Paenibacillus tritici]QUL55485.1 hypothetical protein KDC22_02575 [Paenibacillus tritici]